MKSILLIFLTASAVSALPLRGKKEIRYPMLNPDLIEGDILVNDPTDRSVMRDLNTRWPNAVVPYVIDRSVWHLRPILREAMEQYYRKTCIRFVPKEPHHNNYIKIFAGIGCWSQLGMVSGEQPLSLGIGCETASTAMHELGHALGMNHEHNRSDRDDFIDIFWENVERGYVQQFNKEFSENEILYTPFDYDSVMIYGKYLASKDYGNLKTMESKKGFPPLSALADPENLSKFDIYKVNKMYNCKNIYNKD